MQITPPNSFEDRDILILQINCTISTPINLKWWPNILKTNGISTPNNKYSCSLCRSWPQMVVMKINIYNFLQYRMLKQEKHSIFLYNYILYIATRVKWSKQEEKEVSWNIFQTIAHQIHSHEWKCALDLQNVTKRAEEYCGKGYGRP